MIVAPKYDKEGKVSGIRICLDSRRLNSVLEQDDKFSVPQVAEGIRALKNKKFFGEFDLTEASEKVIIMLSRVMLTNTWATLSPNIYGELSFSSIETDIHCYYTNPFAR